MLKELLLFAFVISVTNGAAIKNDRQHDDIQSENKLKSASTTERAIGHDLGTNMDNTSNKLSDEEDQSEERGGDDKVVKPQGKPVQKNTNTHSGSSDNDEIPYVPPKEKFGTHRSHRKSEIKAARKGNYSSDSERYLRYEGLLPPSEHEDENLDVATNGKNMNENAKGAHDETNGDATQ